jgi:very-short-patch-repair endonuclease
MVDIARRLRAEMTPAEKALWEELRGRRFRGFKFRRQHPIGCFVVDFYCPEMKLIVEVDGGIHDSLSQRVADEEREEWLSILGLRIVRIPNDMVLTDTQAALDRIAAALSPTPLHR